MDHNSECCQDEDGRQRPTTTTTTTLAIELSDTQKILKASGP